MTFVYVRMDVDSYELSAVDTDTSAAMDTLRAEWERRQRQLGYPSMHWTEAVEYFGVTTLTYKQGKGVTR